MQFKTLAILAAAVGTALAQRPANISICDYYTTALLKNNTAANQYTLLTLVVNTAVIGNYTKPNVGISVPGILATNATYNGTAVNLLPYFDGGLASSNRGGANGVAINFLDDGAAVPLMNNMPANGTSSNQYMLLTHLYQYFGVLLGCSMQGPNNGSTPFSAYQGQGSQYNVHKFMDLNPYQVGYFIEQVGMAAASFGVTTADVTAVGMALTKLFDYRCAPPTTVVPAQGAQLQSICIDSTCPLSPNATCAAYAPAVQPAVANVTLAMGEGNSSKPLNGSSTMSTSPAMATKNVAASNSFAGGAMAAVVGAAALAFAL
ncbi:MAG: hypothetical protein M1827_005215 [Pycnora praestabilis]|nr:MAG: hypothetical protein M1827_005215 [Pycnora praestabilis]